MALNNVFNIFYLVLKYNIYIYQFKSCPIPYLMLGETFFCDYHKQRDSLSTSIPPYFKNCKNGQKWTIEK